MTEIRDWLEELSLGQYADAFEMEEISPADLTEFTEDDLKALGLAMGPRRRVLKAVREHDVQAPSAAPATEPATPRKADRRQITVMFCDLVGSTALSESLDPEDLREVMAAYQKSAGTVIESYQGHVAQYLGDGLMTYFGWPGAHEDDAQRAVRAGLEIVEAVRGIKAQVPISVRVGISTGPVVVGETGSGDASVPKAAVGEAPNLAARIQGFAEPNTVMVGESTRKLIAGSFELEDLGTQPLKGIKGGATIYRVLGKSKAESRFEAAQTAGTTVFVGREDEVGMLVSRWSQAKDGDGQVMLLCGEPGIGKSRITQELWERLAKEPHTRLRYQCSPYYANSAFHPVIEQLERAAGFARHDTPDQKLDKLEDVLAQGIENAAAVAPLIGAMLSLSVSRYPRLTLTPQRQKEKTIEALTNQIVGLAHRNPVLMILEDAHWIDPTTMEVVNSIIDRIQNQPVLIVITFRPEFEPRWSGYGHVTVHTLNRFGRRLGAAMVANVTGGKGLPDEVLDQIVEKTDGIPLFVEELTRTVLEAGFLQDKGDHYELDGPLPALAIPATLQDSLMARLDRLAPFIKEVVQIGAAIGREFSRPLLAASSTLSEEELDRALAELVDAELVFRRGIGWDAVYVFKHALVQDTAYASLLRSSRQQLHQRIASGLQQTVPEIAETAPEILGYHYTEAGATEPAIDHWRRAGARAAERSADVEALAHLERALALLTKLPESAERDARELELLIDQTSRFIAVKGYAGPEVERINARALALCDRLGDVPDVFPVLYGRWALHFTSGRCAESYAWATEVLRRAQGQSSALPRAVAHRLLGNSALLVGKPAQADENLARAADLFGEKTGDGSGLIYGQDIAAAIYIYQALAQWYLGCPDKAFRHANRAFDRAEQLQHANTFCYVSYHAAWLYGLAQRFDRMDNFAQRLIGIADENQLEMWKPTGFLFRSWGLLAASPSAKAQTQFETATANYRTRMGILTPMLAILLAASHGKTGDAERGLTILGEARAHLEEGGERIHEAELYRVWGELENLRGDTGAAEARYRRAIDIAVAQSANYCKLRAVTSLGRLWQSQGQREKARDILAPVYNWFTEGFDTADMKNAKSLLDTLE